MYEAIELVKPGVNLNIIGEKIEEIASKGKSKKRAFLSTKTLWDTALALFYI